MNDRPLDSRQTAAAFTLVEIMIVILIIGILAALAIPTYRRVRANAQDRAVLNNARQISGAAEQYFHEFGASNVATAVLLGKGYIRQIATVAGEGYPTVVNQGLPITVTNVAGERTVTYNQ